MKIKPVDVWVIVAKDGSISSAHCTCMAGNSEVCSHVGAILFAAEYANTMKQSRSCTDVKAAWAVPSLSSNIAVVPVKKMDWGKSSAIYEDRAIPAMSSTDKEKMMKDLEDLGHSSALMRIVEPFASKISEENIKILPSLFNIFREDNVNKSYGELIQTGEAVNLNLSEDEINAIETATRKQNKIENWYIQRAGRITASNFKAVCRTHKRTPSLSLLKIICYPTRVLFSTKATLWGISHEDVAVEKYERKMVKECHSSFIVNKVGLIISKKWPQLGASPDRLVYCECCGGGCLEVKCPYLLHVNNVGTIQEYLEMKNSCLIKDGDRITLHKSHSYYYQVQMQIFVTQLLCCDFVVWSPRIFFKERIFPDHEFWNENNKIALKYHSEVIMPELLGRYFTEKAGTGNIAHHCICNGLDDGRPMIQCDRDDCERGWYHFQCVGLVDIPNMPWFCPECNI